MCVFKGTDSSPVVCVCLCVCVRLSLFLSVSFSHSMPVCPRGEDGYGCADRAAAFCERFVCVGVTLVGRATIAAAADATAVAAKVTVQNCSISRGAPYKLPPLDNPMGSFQFFDTINNVTGQN